MKLGIFDKIRIEKNRKELAVQLFSGVIIGLIVFVGTYAGNALYNLSGQITLTQLLGGIIAFFILLVLSTGILSGCIEELKR